MVASWADHNRIAICGSVGYGRKVSKITAEGLVKSLSFADGKTDYGELFTTNLHLVCGETEAGLDKRWGSDIEHAIWTSYSFERPSYGRIREFGYEPHVRSYPSHSKRAFECRVVVRLCTDDCRGTEDSGSL